MTREETAKIFSLLPENDYELLIRLPYGTGMWLMEALRLRIQDIDFEKNEITVHCGKGAKDRKTVLPVLLKFPLQKHLEKVRRIHEADCKDGFGSVSLPFALAKNIPLQVKRGHGNGGFHKHADGKIKKLVSRDGIISILRLFSELCMKRF